MSVSGGNISLATYNGAVGTVFAFALLAAGARTVIRLKKFRRIYIDDYFLFIGVASLIAGTTLLYLTIPTLYVELGIAAGEGVSPWEFGKQKTTIVTMYFVGQVLAWVTIFAVKFSFLFFFRSLIRRLRYLTIWWWCVLASVILVALADIAANLVHCPNGGSALIQCPDPRARRRQHVLIYFTFISDIITDAMLISIPVWLLWQSKLNLRLKLGLGSVLCLSIFMISITIVRVSAARTYGAAKYTLWWVFWLEVEACVGVIMISINAFRIVMVDHHTRRSLKRLSPWQSNGGKREKDAPGIPLSPTGGVGGPTVAGMRTMIRENGRTIHGSFGSGGLSLPVLSPGVGTMSENASRSAANLQHDPSCESFV